MPIRSSLRRSHVAFFLEALEPRELLSFDPTAQEQYMLELLNRMRLNPAAELAKLTSSLGNPARSSEPNIDAALRYFNTSGTALAQQWSSLVPTTPLAWNANLYAAAEGHDNAMIAADQQTHQAPGEPDLGDRDTNAGYIHWTLVGENVYAFAENTLHAHAGFAIDWGNDTDGIQNPPGHRDNMMDSTYREVGIRILTPGNVPGHQVGPWVVSQEFGRRYDQGNPFLLGVAYADANNDGYSPGEGFGGVTITAVSGDGSPGGLTYTTTSLSAGGWQMQVPAGTYAVTVSGAGFGSAVTYHSVVVGSSNVKLDAVRGVAPPVPVIRVLGNSIAIASNDTTPNRTDFTDLGNANLTNQSIERTFTITNAGTQTLVLANFLHVNITGANASDFTLIADASTTIAPGGSTTFTIAFDPSALGTRSAAVTIHSTDPNTPTYTFAIQGHGIKRPIAQVSGHQVVIADGDTTPTTADWSKFAGVNTQFATKVRIFTITNIGLNNLRIAGANGAPAVTISGPQAYLFTVFVQPATTLVPGASTQFRVRFTPAGYIGFANATISIASSDPMTPGYSFAIQGNGLAQPHIQVSGGGIPILAGDSSPSLADKTSFGNVLAGVRSLARLYTITNLGLTTLDLSAPFVTISGPDAGEFLVSAFPAIIHLAPGASTTFKVRFTPTGTAFRTATVNIATNDPALNGSGGVFSFAVAGTGV